MLESRRMTTKELEQRAEKQKSHVKDERLGRVQDIKEEVDGHPTEGREPPKHQSKPSKLPMCVSIVHIEREPLPLGFLLAIIVRKRLQHQ